MKILITAATTALAHKLKSKLNSPDVILGDYLELPAFMLEKQGMLQLPNPAADSYTHLMLALCLDNDIETVYLLNKAEADVLLLSEQLFKEYNISLVNGTIEI
ncbi:hypothetical protein FFF34_006010 [Inquilinus sp. KBS0705]|nr:hypothetical protein FFF34_006010 [Inquilinus sp. KBS0705]